MTEKRTLSFSFLNRLTFWPAGSLIRQGRKHVLKHDELWKLPQQFQAEELWNLFEPNWKNELQKEKPSLPKAIVKTFWKRYLGALLFNISFGICSYNIPIIIPFMLEYINDTSLPLWYGFVYIGIIIVMSLIGTFCYYTSIYLNDTTGLRVRSVLMQLVYRKVLTLAPDKNSNSGLIVNLLANDAQFVNDTLLIFTNGIIAPVLIIITTGLVSIHVGAFSLLAPGVLLFLIPWSFWYSQRFGRYRMKIQGAADKRLKLTNELISGIRIVKYYAWEEAFIKNIESSRETELEAVKALSMNRALLIFVMSNTVVLIIALIFLFYGLYGPEALTASKAFATLSFINLLRGPVFVMPLSITFFQQYIATFDRLQNFLSKPEVKDTNLSSERLGKAQLVFEDAEFKYDERPILSGVNLKVTNGQLAMIVGNVGSGKSSMVSAILGQMIQSKGTRSLEGSVAYVPQEAWIVNASIRDNIVFGETWDEEKYNRVVSASALSADFKQLPNGDSTEIGERGITLSGGQKQRVSIARALYADRDLYLLDDPFSAVDAHVGKHLFEHAVREYLKGKTIILATNQLQYLPRADQIIVLKDGKIEANGGFQELRTSNPYFSQMMSQFGEMETDETPQQTSEKKPETKEEKANATPSQPKKDGSSAPLIKAEQKQEGLVSWRVYWYYIVAGGAAFFVIAQLFFIATVGTSVTSAWWLTVWTTDGKNYDTLKGKETGFYVGIYIGFLVLQATISLVAFYIFFWFTYSASRFLHNTMLRKLARAPASFFDVTPVGRIINRFAKELSLVDMMLPVQLIQLCNGVYQLFGVFAAMLFASPYIILAIAPMIVFYVWFQQYYRHTSIELQRMEALSRAPILSHLSETINGVTSIRAYGLQDKFRLTNRTRVNFNATEIFSMRYCAAFFGMRLDWAGLVLVTITMLAIVLTRIYAPDNLEAGFAGLAMTYAAGISGFLSTLNSMMVETETRMNSVERIKEYDSLPQEAADVVEGNRPPADWPQKGTVQFQDYSLKYREGGEMVLKQINVKIKSKSKVGIVGRTGAGKSSLMQALFRMVEPAEGTIIIDGVDVAKIGLRDLRSKLSIIPQEPILFIGTIRYNLDPFGEYEDAKIWQVLQMVRLKNSIEKLPGKLDEPVAENGGNLSVGERQLVCMARALLRQSKILLMDEATASVDLNTDSLIQKMVRKHFKDVTVLTIAHRLNTIMDSTKVMVLDKGQLAEFDAPIELLNKEDSIFSGMVNATGSASAQYLRKIAKGEIDIMHSFDPNASIDTAPTPRKKKSKKEKKEKKQKKENKEEIKVDIIE